MLIRKTNYKNEGKVKKVLAVCTTALLAVGLAVGLSAPANATGDPYAEVCVPSDAWTEVISPEVPATEGSPEVPAVYETVVTQEAGWQRYSWTGGPIEEGVTPSFPSDDWQPNVKGDPHGIGKPGAYDVSRGGSGNADWFYLEAIPELTEQVLVTPAIPAVPGTPYIPAVVVEHEAVVCDDEPEEPEVPAKPPVRTEETSSRVVDCESGVVVTRTTVLTYDSILVDNRWVEQDATAVHSESERPATTEECPVVVTPPTEEEPPVVTPPTEEPPVVTPPTEEPPVIEPPVTEPPAVTPPVVQPPVTVAKTLTELPETGQHTDGLLGAGIVAALLILGGLGAFLFNRRKKVTETE